MSSNVSLFLVVLATAMAIAMVQASPLATLASADRTLNVSEQWNLVKESIETNKESLCSYLLRDIEDGDEQMNLKGVTELFERSLDHLAKASEYVAKIRPFVDPKVIKDFDLSGGQFVLEISNSRRNLLDQYETAEKNNASEEFKRDLLNKYFYKACSSKLGTILAEKSMHDSLLKVEKRIRSTLEL